MLYLIISRVWWTARCRKKVRMVKTKHIFFSFLARNNKDFLTNLFELVNPLPTHDQNWKT